MSFFKKAPKVIDANENLQGKPKSITCDKITQEKVQNSSEIIIKVNISSQVTMQEQLR